MKNCTLARSRRTSGTDAEPFAGMLRGAKISAVGPRSPARHSTSLGEGEGPGLACPRGPGDEILVEVHGSGGR